MFIKLLAHTSSNSFAGKALLELHLPALVSLVAASSPLYGTGSLLLSCRIDDVLVDSYITIGARRDARWNLTRKIPLSIYNDNI
jgi:hypothetical protein